MKIKIKLSIINNENEPFMGIGLIWLLEKIKEHKSIRKAAAHMDMSYAKAHRILKNLEKNLGEKIIVTKIGGIERGGANLTPFGEEFINKYDEYQKKIKDYAEIEFIRFLEDIKKI
jgi:molybdate transport system regulatory protein